MISPVIEALAELVHDEWMSWSKNIVTIERISPKTYKRWVPIWVPYEELSEKMKERNRVWARKALKIIEDVEIDPVRHYAECVRMTGDRKTLLCNIAECKSDAVYISRPGMSSGMYCKKHFYEIYNEPRKV